MKRMEYARGPAPVWMPMYVANYPTTLRLELVGMAQDK